MMLITIMLLGALVASYPTADGWVGLNDLGSTPTPPEIKICESVSSFLRMEIKIAGMHIESRVVDGITYHRLDFPGCSFTHDVGRPRIPVIRELIAIPECDHIQLNVMPGDSVVLDGYNVYPTPRLVEQQTPDGYTYLAEEFVRDESFHSIDSYSPGVYGELLDSAHIRDQRIAHIACYPIQFDPVTKQLKLYSKLQIELTFTNPRGTVQVTGEGIFGKILSHTILNCRPTSETIMKTAQSGSVHRCSSVEDCARGQIDYLMIAAAVFDDYPEAQYYNACIDSLAEKRAIYNRFNVGIINAQNIQGYQFSSEGIRDFIRAVYETHSAGHIPDGRLGYVLLVGDAFSDDGVDTLIPVASNYYYSCLDCDNFPDLMIARLSVGNQEELRAATTKILDYEPLPPDSVWRKNILLTAGTFTDAHNPFTWLRQFIPEEYDVSEVHMLDIGRSAAIDSNVSKIRTGQLIVDYFGHGGLTTWQSLDCGHLNLLANHDRLPFILNVACNTGKYYNSYRDCMAERFVNADGCGAIAFFACDRLDSEGTSNWYGTNTYIINAIFSERVYEIGGAVMEATIKRLRDDGSGYCARTYNLFGDPAVNIMAENPPGHTPDLVIKNSYIFFNPSRPKLGEPVTINSAVCNRSIKEIDQAFCVRFYLGDPDDGGRLIGSHEISSMQAYEMDTLQVAFTTSDLNTAYCKIFVRADDEDDLVESAENNNQGSKDMRLFVVGSTLPANGSVGVHSEHGISASFLIDMDGTSICDSVFVVSGNQSGRHTGNVSYHECDRTAVFNSHKNFNPGEVVTVALTTGIQELAGKPLSDGYVWSYTTEVDTAMAVFELTASSSVGNDPRSVCAGDFDKDGHVDLAVANHGSGSLSVLRNLGHGNLVQVFSYDFPDRPTSLCSGDFNSDGVLDLALTTFETIGHLVVLWGEGDCTFTRVWSHLFPFHSVPRKPVCVHAGHLSGDGYLDLAVGEENFGEVWIFLGNGQGKFACHSSFRAGGKICSIRMADFNHDGYFDLATTHERSNRISSFLNDGCATFSLTGEYTVGQKPKDTQIGDFNGDLDLDIVVVNCNSSTISVLMGNGDGTFSQTTDYPIPEHPLSIFSGDFDGDRNLDIAVAASYPGAVLVFSGDENGQFHLEQNYPASNVNIVTGADFDDDGDIDLALGYYPNIVSVMLNADPPMVSSSPRATALSNGQKIRRVPGSDTIWCCYESKGKIFVTCSVNGGNDWELSAIVSDTLRHCGFPALSLDATSHPHIVWTRRSRLYWATYDGSAWTDPFPLTHADGGWEYRIPALSVERDSLAHTVWIATTEPVQASHPATKLCYGTWNVTGGPFVQSIIDSSNATEPCFCPCITTDSAGRLHLCYSKKGDIWYRNRNDAGWQETPDNVSGSKSSSISPSILIHRNRLHVVWEEESPAGVNNICHRSKNVNDEWLAPPRAIRNTPGNSCQPVIIGDGSIVVWAETSRDSIPVTDIVYSKRNGLVWSNPVNLSNTTGSSTYPNAFGYEIEQGGFAVCWTEGDAKPYHVVYETVDIPPRGLAGGNQTVETNNMKAPKRFALPQNSPNPVRSSTAIRYQLPRTTHVFLRIYDTAGRLLRTLVDENQESGYYCVDWDGKDSFGRKVGSGAYFYRIEVHPGAGLDTDPWTHTGKELTESVLTKKMILLR